MDDLSMRRYVPLLIAGAALIAAACSDPAAPTRSTSDLPALTLLSPMAMNASAYDQAETHTFTLNPRGGIEKIGAYRLRYDANAVCDLTTSSYGPTEWEKSCTTLTVPITIVGRFWIEDGRTHADFSPDIRFDPSKNVTMSTRVPSLHGVSLTDAVRHQYTIGYTRVANGMRYFIDEAASDPSLATVFAEKNGSATGWVSRRVLHFSGYYVRSGRSCDEITGECTDLTIEEPIY